MQIPPLAEQFCLYLEAQNASSPLTIQACRADMKCFLGFLDREGIAPEIPNLTTNPCQRLSTPRHEKAIPEYLTPDEGQALRDATEDQYYSLLTVRALDFRQTRRQTHMGSRTEASKSFAERRPLADSN